MILCHWNPVVFPVIESDNQGNHSPHSFISFDRPGDDCRGADDWPDFGRKVIGDDDELGRFDTGF